MFQANLTKAEPKKNRAAPDTSTSSSSAYQENASTDPDAPVPPPAKRKKSSEEAQTQPQSQSSEPHTSSQANSMPPPQLSISSGISQMSMPLMLPQQSATQALSQSLGFPSQNTVTTSQVVPSMMQTAASTNPLSLINTSMLFQDPALLAQAQNPNTSAVPGPARSGIVSLKMSSKRF